MEYLLPEIFDLIVTYLDTVSKMSLSMTQTKWELIKAPLTYTDKCRSPFHLDYPNNAADAIRYVCILEFPCPTLLSRSGYAKIASVFDPCKIPICDIILFINGHSLFEIELYARYNSNIIPYINQFAFEITPNQLCDIEYADTLKYFYRDGIFYGSNIPYFGARTYGSFRALMELGVGRLEYLDYSLWIFERNADINFMKEMFTMMKPADFSRFILDDAMLRTTPLEKLKWLYSLGCRIKKINIGLQGFQMDVVMWLIEINKINHTKVCEYFVRRGLYWYEWISNKCPIHRRNPSMLKEAIGSQWNYEDFKQLFSQVSADIKDSSIFDSFKSCCLPENEEAQKILIFLCEQGYVIKTGVLIDWIYGQSCQTEFLPRRASLFDLLITKKMISDMDAFLKVYCQCLDSKSSWLYEYVLIKHGYGFNEFIPYFCGCPKHVLKTAIKDIHSFKTVKKGYWGEDEPYKYLKYISENDIHHAVMMYDPDDESSIFYYTYYRFLFRDSSHDRQKIPFKFWSIELFKRLVVLEVFPNKPRHFMYIWRKDKKFQRSELRKFLFGKKVLTAEDLDLTFKPQSIRWLKR